MNVDMDTDAIIDIETQACIHTYRRIHQYAPRIYTYYIRIYVQFATEKLSHSDRPAGFQPPFQELTCRHALSQI